MYTNDIALVGLAVMGQNLALNLARNGFKVTVYNRTWEKTRDFMAGSASNTNIIAARDIQACVASLKTPRTVLLMVKAGQPVDDLLEELSPLLSPKDLVMDGGNSLYTDTVRRQEHLAARGIGYMGVGISGGEHGALHGPSIMAGGEKSQWPYAASLLEAIAARSSDGQPCADYMGAHGAGHFVKMVHNGVEYAAMQIIAEVYDILRQGCGCTPDKIADLFEIWGQGPFRSYLIEITTKILRAQDTQTKLPVLELIADRAASKGTGLWTLQAAHALGVPAPTITAAVEARMLSTLSAQRREAARILRGPEPSTTMEPDAVRDALTFALICAYAQGFAIVHTAEQQWNWEMDLIRIAKVWRAGCIIRIGFLDEVVLAFAHPSVSNLILHEPFRAWLHTQCDGLRQTLCQAHRNGIPAPALSSALNYYDGYRREFLPTNLIQAQRDFFGRHGFERNDSPGIHHGPWHDSVNAK